MVKADLTQTGCQFVMRGGRYDGMVFRLYPDNAGDVRKDMAPVWSDLTLDPPAIVFL